MAQPGFSISELIAAIAVAKKVYNAFSHTYESAPARIKELTETLRYFRDTLIDLEAILRHYGTFYHGQLSFTRKLEECEAFLLEYSELRSEHSTVPNQARPTTVQISRRVWQITKLAFDDRTTLLRDGLSMELEKLTNFFLRFILLIVLSRMRTVPGTEIAVSSRTPATLSNLALYSRSSDRENFGRLLRQLQDVRDSYTGELYLAEQTGRDPDFSAIYPVLENAWHLLCHRVGFSGERIPPVPREGLLQSSLLADGMVVASTNSSENLLSDVEISSFDDRSRTNNRTGTVTINFAMKTERNIDRRSGRRTGIIQRYSYSLQRYAFSQGPMGPAFTWTDQSSSMILRHYVPTGTFPHTLHHEVGNPLGISFLEGGRHEISLDEGNVFGFHSTALDVEYKFTLKAQHQQFQEDLRNKNLLKTFELYHIRSKRSGKYYEAIKQDVKLWRSRDHHKLHSLSFNSNVVEKQHIEFPICWFDGKMDRNRGDKTVTLYFVQRITRSLPPDDSHKRWPRLPKFPLRRTKSKEPETPPITLDTTATPTASTFPPSSESSLYDIETSSSFSNDHRFAPSDIATDLSFLYFEFSSLDHYTSFITEFEEAYKLDTPSETFIPPQLRLVREDPGEMHSDQ